MIKSGATRFVFFCGDRVYKVARFPVFRAFARLLRHASRGEAITRINRLPPGVARRYLLGGLLSNQEEWYIGTKYPRADFARVYNIYLFGLVLVQERGRDIPDDVAVVHPFWNLMLRSKSGNVADAREQFAYFAGETKLVDFARGDLEPGMFP